MIPTKFFHLLNYLKVVSIRNWSYLLFKQIVINLRTKSYHHFCSMILSTEVRTCYLLFVFFFYLVQMFNEPSGLSLTPDTKYSLTSNHMSGYFCNSYVYSRLKQRENYFFWNVFWNLYTLQAHVQKGGVPPIAFFLYKTIFLLKLQYYLLIIIDIYIFYFC